MTLFAFKGIFAVIWVAVFYAIVRMIFAWPIMLLVDSATQGAWTISYGQALAISVLAGLIMPGHVNTKKD